MGCGDQTKRSKIFLIFKNVFKISFLTHHPLPEKPHVCLLILGRPRREDREHRRKLESQRKRKRDRSNLLHGGLGKNFGKLSFENKLLPIQFFIELNYKWENNLSLTSASKKTLFPVKAKTINEFDMTIVLYIYQQQYFEFTTNTCFYKPYSFQWTCF